MNKVLKYDAESIQVLSPRESVRQNLGMYIGNSDSSGLHQLFVEMVANSIDEAVAGYGNNIIVRIDTQKNSLTVQDNGRGLPFGRKTDGTDAIVDATCSLHGGGKFEGATGYKSSLGLHGLGLKVTHYLSKYFEVVSCRDGKCCFLSFDEKDNMCGPKVVNEVTGNRGTQVTFIPDEKIFGNNKWDLQLICDKLQTYALLNNNITFRLEVDGKEKARYIYSDGIKDLFAIKAENKNLVVKPTFHKVKVANENGDEAEFEFAIGYTEDGGEREYCYANGGETPNGGSYLTGFKSGYTSLVNKAAKAAGIEKNFSGELIRRGLLLIMIMRADFRLSFAEQTKLTLNSPEARGLASKAISSLKFDSATLKAILKKIENEQKVEEAAQRKREAQEKITHGGSKLNALKDLPEKLADATDFTDAEIFFCEGDSAAAGLKEMKKPNQAVLALRGKIKNVSSIELSDVLKSETITSILNCLGCGVGEHFNINHLRYKRILLLFDADADRQNCPFISLPSISGVDCIG